MKQSMIRHVIDPNEGTLTTLDGTRRVEVNYREFSRLNTLAALETAFLEMGFHLVKRCHDQVIYEKTARRTMTKTCTVPGCDHARMISKRGKTLTMCEEHQREYWRKRNPSTGNKRGRPSKHAYAPVLPPPELPLHIRIIALRCDACGVKQPYTDELFDVAARARICRCCVDAVAVR